MPAVCRTRGRRRPARPTLTRTRPYEPEAFTDACRRRRLSLPAVAAGPGMLHPAQPDPDGLDAHRPGRGRPRFRADGGLLRRAGRCRRRPDGDRRHRTRRGRCPEPQGHRPRPRRAGRGPSPGDPGGARAGGPDLPADPARRSLRGPSGLRRASMPRASRSRSPISRPRPPAPAKPATTGSR